MSPLEELAKVVEDFYRVRGREVKVILTRKAENKQAPEKSEVHDDKDTNHRGIA